MGSIHHGRRREQNARNPQPAALPLGIKGRNRSSEFKDSATLVRWS